MTTIADSGEASANRFEMLVQSVTDYAIYMLDTAGNVATWNTGAQLVKGYAKDEIIGLMFARDDWHIVLGVLGYLGALLTAIYTFRMIFRAFLGEPGEAVQARLDGAAPHGWHEDGPAASHRGPRWNPDSGGPTRSSPTRRRDS